MNFKSLRLNALALLFTPTIAFTYDGSSFNEVWDEVKNEPYFELSDTKVTRKSFFQQGYNLLAEAAKRTVEDKNDIIPPFDKLLHANGICLQGEWKITESSIYSGYFRKGSKGKIIARASTTLTNTKRGSYRGFGLAGKIFPTNNGDEVVKTANFFLIDNLIGTYAPNFTRVEMTNEPSLVPPISLSVAKIVGLGLAAVNSFAEADKKPGIRQLYPVSRLDEDGEVRTPKWMMAKGDDNESINSLKDFRDEINQHISENGKFTMGIYTSDTGKKNWQRVGSIIFKESVASWACDHRLHFHHQKFEENMK